LSDGTSSLVFADGKGTSRAVYSFAPSGASSVIFADRDGITRSGLGLDSRGHTLFAGDVAVSAPQAQDEAPAADSASAEPKRR
jgi:hypothetical protein